MRWRGDLHELVASINRSRRVTESSSDSTHLQSHLRPYSPFSLAQIKHPLFSPAGSVLTQTTHTSPNSSHSNSDYRQQLACTLWTCPNSEASHVHLLSSSQFRPYSFSFSGSVVLQMPLTSPYSLLLTSGLNPNSYPDQISELLTSCFGPVLIIGGPYSLPLLDPFLIPFPFRCVLFPQNWLYSKSDATHCPFLAKSFFRLLSLPLISTSHNPSHSLALSQIPCYSFPPVGPHLMSLSPF